MGLLDGRAGLVTGGAGGIGRATVIRFAQEGASVLVADLESQRAAGEETVRLAARAGGRAIFVACDVTHEDEQRELVRTCAREFGALDFAHNNAGIDLAAATVEDTTVEDWDAVIEVNLKGVWLGMKHQLPAMRAQGGGAIVNTSSVAGLWGVPHLAAYVASKFGVVGLTRAAAIEAADAGIRVNCICPGVVRTAMVGALDAATQAQMISPHAIKRMGEPSEVAETVVWLCSDRASMITGTSFPVDLGTTAGVVP